MNSENTPLSINVNQSHIRNAVRDIVEKLLLPEAARQSVDAHVQKQMQRITAHTESVINNIAVSPAQVCRMVENILNRDLHRMVTDTVKRMVEEMVKEEVSIALRHLVETGLTLEIGTGYKRTAKIKTELKEAGR